ncbi:MAG: hypothetical protein J2P29_07955, partial [Actinobacteria bacterium]|nr:hypothetical protein [Actinomycetota bacterium]
QLAASGSSGTTVQVAYRSATAPQAVPGVTITSRSGTTARGMVSAATGARFGAALARQWLADHASPTHTTGLFASVARISAATAAPAATPAAQPGFIMHTLTLNGRNQKGQKDTGDLVLVYNVDDLAAFVGSATFHKGIAKLSVPEGHYAAFSFFFDFPSQTVHLAALPQFTVGADTSITLDARDATSPVTITTSRPASPASNVLGIARDDALGKEQPFTFLGGGTISFFAEPTQPVTVGQFHYYFYTRMFAPDGSYSYDLDFPSDGAIPADQHYVADDSTLAAVDTSYPASHDNQESLDARFGAAPWQQDVFAANFQFTTPTERTEYYSARPDVIWSGLDFTVFDSNPFALLGTVQSAWRSYSPGTSFATTWGGTPAGPRLLEGATFRNETICPACLNGTRLSLLSYPFSDNSPEHYGFTDGSASPGLTESVSHTVSADGVPVQQGGFLETSVTMPGSAQTYRIDYDTTRSSPDFLLSTAAQTSWSVPATVATGSLPAGWVCDPSGSTSCGVVPLITNSYHLPVSQLGALPAGPATGQLDLGHLGGAGIAFTAVSVNVSYDSGQSWQPVTVTDLGSGQFGLAFTVPAAAGTDGYGALQVSVTDAAGGTFDQTIQHAFAVGS